MSDNSLLEKLETFYIRFREIGQLITDPEVIQDMNRFVKLNKEYRDLEQIVEAGDELKRAVSSYDEAQEILNTETDKELKEMAEMEIEELDAKIPELESKVKMLLVPADPEDSKNVILEIRAGTGGDEASLFAGDLFRMYTKFCESKRWKIEITNYSEGTSGGYKEIVANITGDGVYGIMKYESGVHRVQRVPATETQGRVHTSAATVAVLPEAEEVDVEIDEKDVRIDVMRASGNGGQCVNTTDSAVRLTHYPTGIVIYSQTEKSQIQNKAKAFALLRAKLYDMECQKAHDAEAEARRSQIGTGDRSEKIRTYNFPQGRVTDHRINLTLYKLDKIMNGDIQEIIDACIAADQAKKLAKMGEE